MFEVRVGYGINEDGDTPATEEYRFRCFLEASKKYAEIAETKNSKNCRTVCIGKIIFEPIDLYRIARA